MHFASFTARYVVSSPLFFNEFPGTALRGCLLESMKTKVMGCDIKKNCSSCRKKTNCDYSLLFDHPYAKGKAPTPVHYHPLILKPPRRRYYDSGDSLSFGFTLVGSSIERLPALLQALTHCTAIAKSQADEKQRGGIAFSSLENHDAAGNTRHMAAGGALIEKVQTALIRPEMLLPGEGKYRVWLRSRTPLLLINTRRELVQDIQASTLLKSIYERMAWMDIEWCGAGGGKPAAPVFPYIRMDGVQLRFSGTHYISGKTGIETVFRGWEGRILYSDMPADCLQLLLAGTYLHAGKHAGFGFGWYNLEY